MQAFISSSQLFGLCKNCKVKHSKNIVCLDTTIDKDGIRLLLDILDPELTIISWETDNIIAFIRISGYFIIPESFLFDTILPTLHHSYFQPNSFTKYRVLAIIYEAHRQNYCALAHNLCLYSYNNNLPITYIDLTNSPSLRRFKQFIHNKLRSRSPKPYLFAYKFH